MSPSRQQPEKLQPGSNPNSPAVRRDIEMDRNVGPHNSDDTVQNDGDTEFSDETIASLKELGAVFRDIRNRLISEGYVIKDGMIQKPTRPPT